MNRRVLLALLALLLCGSALILARPGGVSRAQTSGRYDLEWHVVGVGGGGMASDTYLVEGTLGPAASGYAAGARYAIRDGLWLAQGLHPIHLPLVLRGR